MLKKVLIALLLILNHSVMFGTMEAEEIPDAAHPYGQTFEHELLHHHSHQHEHHDASSTATDSGHHDEYEPHHEHGAHTHLNMDVPQTISLDLQRQSGQASTSYALPHQSQTYSPPVPPPNR
ncbi:MAG: hypothetical protein V4751_12710 [Pseudomonadota bacterium]